MLGLIEALLLIVPRHPFPNECLDLLHPLRIDLDISAEHPEVLHLREPQDVFAGIDHGIGAIIGVDHSVVTLG